MLTSIGFADSQGDRAERGRDVRDASEISHKGKMVVPITEIKKVGEADLRSKIENIVFKHVFQAPLREKERPVYTENIIWGITSI